MTRIMIYPLDAKTPGKKEFFKKTMAETQVNSSAPRNFLDGDRSAAEARLRKLVDMAVAELRTWELNRHSYALAMNMTPQLADLIAADIRAEQVAVDRRRGFGLVPRRSRRRRKAHLPAMSN
jgi:hypothetical protein